MDQIIQFLPNISYSLLANTIWGFGLGFLFLGLQIFPFRDPFNKRVDYFANTKEEFTEANQFLLHRGQEVKHSSGISLFLDIDGKSLFLTCPKNNKYCKRLVLPQDFAMKKLYLINSNRLLEYYFYDNKGESWLLLAKLKDFGIAKINISTCH